MAGWSLKPDTVSLTPWLCLAGLFLLFVGIWPEDPRLDSLLFPLGLLKGSRVTSNRKNSTVHILCVVTSPLEENAEPFEAHGRHVGPDTNTPLNFRPALQKVSDVWAKVIYDSGLSVDLSHFHQEM